MFASLLLLYHDHDRVVTREKKHFQSSGKPVKVNKEKQAHYLPSMQQY